MKKVLALFFLLFCLSQQNATNCNGNANGNVLEFEDDLDDETGVLNLNLSKQECNDANTCIAECGKNSVVMKVNLDDPNISKGLKNAYLGVCMWRLERSEIENKLFIKNPKSRGQYISQIVARLSFPYVSKLPKSPVPFVFFTKLRDVSHFKRMTVNGYNTAEEMLQNPSNYIHDWIDYMIYVSDSFTVFKDLCKYHTTIDKALKEYSKKLKYVFYKTILDPYRPQSTIQPNGWKSPNGKSWDCYMKLIQSRNKKVKHQKKALMKFYQRVVPEIILKFKKLYDNPSKTCSCWDILNKRSVTPFERHSFSQIIQKSCKQQ